MTDRATYYQAEEARAVREERYEDAAKWRDMGANLAAMAAVASTPLQEGVQRVKTAPFNDALDALRYLPYSTYRGSSSRGETGAHEDHSTFHPVPDPETRTPPQYDGFVWRCEKALEQHLKDRFGMDGPSLIRREGFRIRDHRTGTDEFYLRGELVMLVDWKKMIWELR